MFEGILRGGLAAGTFSFTPNAAFPAELAKRGFARPSAGNNIAASIAMMAMTTSNSIRVKAPPFFRTERVGNSGIARKFIGAIWLYNAKAWVVNPFLPLA